MLATVRFSPVFVLALAAALPAQVLRVPSQYPTIAAALAAASSGSRILVAAGTYQENLTWPSVDGIQLLGEGAGTTIVDGNAAGTVLRFGSGLSRATVVDGLTFRNGFLQNSSNRNYGVGIVVSGCSPTIRRCRITGNIGDGIYWNYGGGFYITGNSNPLIAGNEIDHNELRNGSWNYGAGIYVDSSASADIVGNFIHDNLGVTLTTTSGGRGHGAGIYVNGTALIASNLIVGNTNNTSSWNYGGGIAVSSGTATISNNTIVNNTVSSGNWRYGGGVYVDSSGTATLRGNLIGNNTGHGIYFAGGSGIVSSDWDDVWNNSSSDYSGLSAGPNSLSVDPLFVSSTDWHLSAASPCIDAMPATHLTAAVDVDVDGDPRRLDGDLDGGATDGARLDLGADEFGIARHSITGSPQLGGLVNFDVQATQPALYLLGMTFGTGNLFVDPFGNLLLGPGVVLLGVGATPASLPVPIPNLPGLRGLTAHSQALVTPLPPGAAAQFSNRATLTVF